MKKLVLTAGCLILLSPVQTAKGANELEWIRIRHIGAQDKPIPTIWITTERFEIRESGFYHIVVSTRSAFATVADVTHDFAAMPRENVGELGKFGTLEVVKSANGEERPSFTVAKGGSCRFLTRIVMAGRSAEFSELSRLIINLGRRLACVEPAFAQP